MRLFLRSLIFIGLALTAVPQAVTAADLPRHGVLGAALSVNSGVVTVKAVVPGSAAASAQIESGDVIRSIGSMSVTTSADVIQAIRRTPAGTTLEFAIVRDGQNKALSVTVGAPANEDDPDVQTLYQSVTVNDALRRVLLDVPKHVDGRRPAILLIGGIGCFPST